MKLSQREKDLFRAALNETIRELHKEIALAEQGDRDTQFLADLLGHTKNTKKEYIEQKRREIDEYNALYEKIEEE